MDITNIPNISPFISDNDPTSVSRRWKRWSDRFDNLMTAMNITDKARKKALLLHLAGEAVYDIFQGLVVADVPADTDTKTSTTSTLPASVLLMLISTQNETPNTKSTRSRK